MNKTKEIKCLVRVFVGTGRFKFRSNIGIYAPDVISPKDSHNYLKATLIVEIPLKKEQKVEVTKDQILTLIREGRELHPSALITRIKELGFDDE